MIFVLAVSPQINEKLSSHEVVAREGDTVILNCSAVGVPEPVITWYRRIVSGKIISFTTESELECKLYIDYCL